jgi:predicted lipid-binding transport protein (Tim44 family)
MIPWILLFGEAWARAGGGHGFSGGGGGYSGGGGGYSGGGGGDGGDGLGLLLWLILEHPTVGVPIVVIVAIFLFLQKNQLASRAVYRTQGRSPAARPDLESLRRADPNFSEPLFLDLARLVYTRAQEERGRNNWEALTPFVSEPIIDVLRKRNGGVKDVREVIVASARIAKVEYAGDKAQLSVFFESNVTEDGRALYLRELWLFARTATTLSPGPDRMRALNCPNCGSPIETLRDGRCASCDAVLTDARLQWQVIGAKVLHREPAPGIQLGFGGVEEGTDYPLVQAPDLAAQRRALHARHPEFDWSDFRKRAIEIFTLIQAAWSAGSWEKARPYETDFLYQQHRYWIERYNREGLRNRVEDVVVTDIGVAKITVDAFLEAITVRIYARARDWTETKDGRVVGGSRDKPRVFSEYWTFLRSAGKDARPREHVDRCPSCGAPLDRVSETGVCGYCDAKITGGEFDWVLSTIDQDETYRG